MTNRVMLTPLYIEGLKERGQRYVVYDTKVPSLAVRVSEKGARSFVLSARFSKGANQTRRYLGDASGPNKIELAAARKKAVDWLSKIPA